MSKTLEVEFGDGYSQGAPDGLNPVRDKWNLTWSVLTDSEATAIETFFKARGGHEPFLWTAPDNNTAQQWKIPQGQYTKVDTGGAMYRITVVFKEDFSL